MGMHSLKPKRGTSAAVAVEKNASMILESGEIFIENPTKTGGGRIKIKIGDGATAYKNLPYAVDFIENDPVAFTAATTRENIKTGEKLSVMMGKISKYFTDLKKVAFSNSYNDLDNKPLSLKNPSALTFTGGSTESYDGSTPKSVKIPNSPTDVGALPVNGEAKTAAKLATPRTFPAVNLATGNTANFDGSANPSALGVTGILPSSKGGTGLNNTAKLEALESTSIAALGLGLSVNGKYTGMRLQIGTSSDVANPQPILYTKRPAQTNWEGQNIYTSAHKPTPADIGALASGANAVSATKLATKRNINGTAFDGTGDIVTAKWGNSRTVTLAGDLAGSVGIDGSANVTLTGWLYNCNIAQSNMNNYPFHRIAKIEGLNTNYLDASITLFISQNYIGGGFGIIRCTARTNTSGAVSTCEAKWLVRSGLSVDSVQIGLYNVYGSTYADIFFKTAGTYCGTIIKQLDAGNRGIIARKWTLVSSSEVADTTATDPKTSKECWATIAAAGTALHSKNYTNTVTATDAATVQTANSAGAVAWNSVTGKPSILLTTGGTVTGPIILSGENNSIKGKIGSYTAEVLKIVKPPVNDTTGINAIIQTGGIIVIGGGESPASVYNALTDAQKGSEDVWVTTDAVIHFATISNNDAKTKKEMTYNADGSLTVGTLHGTSDKATVLASTRNIGGVNFNGAANVINYAECSTAAATVAKTVSIANFALVTGAYAMIRFTVTNTAASPTLNINNTGAKPIQYRNAAISAGYLAANRVYLFVYDGSSYELVGDVDTNTNTWVANSATADGYVLKGTGHANQVWKTDANGVPAWRADANTTYTNFVKSGSGAKAGLVPAPSTTAGTTKYLREDCSWQVPPNTTYGLASTSANGLLRQLNGNTGQFMRGDGNWAVAVTNLDMGEEK